ncbi:transmembrane protein 71 isoform X1 [Ascaphus truei]|uniref:transmembrane protein 71 isoform X1 n=2 Tax=Ascaphus truei TaxID=8439 RepID=UPI003F59A291
MNRCSQKVFLQIFKMFQVPHLMSTPVSAKYSSFSRETSTDLPSKLFERYFSSDSCDLVNVDTSHDNSFVNPMSGSFSLCRRSPRLLTNGYYVVDEDSFIFDDNGNVSLSPTKSNVSYKEKIVRIFRRKRKHLTPRTRASWRNDIQEMRSPLEDELLDGDPEVFDNSYSFSSEIADVNSCASRSGPNIMEQAECVDEPPQVPLVRFSSGGFLCMNNDEFAFSYDIKHWTSARQHPEPQRFSPAEKVRLMHPATKSSVPTTSIMLNRDLCEGTLTKSEYNVWRLFHHVTLLSMCLLISMWARLWLNELFAALVTSILVIALVCLANPLSSRSSKPLSGNSKVT